MRFISSIVTYFFVFVFVCCATAAYAEGTAVTISHGGLERIVWILDGRTDKTIPAPVVLALHGFRKPEEAEKLRVTPKRLGWPRLEEIARREGFVAVFPAAYRGQWSLVPGLNNAKHADESPIDDEGFLLTLMAKLKDNGMADPTRLYITGISDGAIMTHRMICLQETPFAAAAALIGTAHEKHIADCKPSHPPALMSLHGDNDPVLPHEGWIFRTGREILVAEVMDHWQRMHRAERGASR